MSNKQQKETYNTLLDSEKRARYFKAEFETMYYALEAEKLRDPYSELVKQKYPDVFKLATEPIKEDANTKEQEG